MSTSLAAYRIVFAGGSGFFGVSLSTHLTAKGVSVVILSRQTPKAAGRWKHVTWVARTLGDRRHELAGATGLVNLTGRTVGCRKTPD